MSSQIKHTHSVCSLNVYIIIIVDTKRCIFGLSCFRLTKVCKENTGPGCAKSNLWSLFLSFNDQNRHMKVCFRCVVFSTHPICATNSKVPVKEQAYGGY